jgi:hypothetical protein
MVAPGTTQHAVAWVPLAGNMACQFKHRWKCIIGSMAILGMPQVILSIPVLVIHHSVTFTTCIGRLECFKTIDLAE